MVAAVLSNCQPASPTTASRAWSRLRTPPGSAHSAVPPGGVPSSSAARYSTTKNGRPSLSWNSRSSVGGSNGPLVRACNHSLRAAILGIADNLIKCNHHFNALAQRWHADRKDPRHTRVKVAFRFCRIAYQMVAGSAACTG